jgi:3-deoxy-D-manno-octulosonate 8-phosphate phosphatase (KDO 8-P phosphatase)
MARDAWRASCTCTICGHWSFSSFTSSASKYFKLEAVLARRIRAKSDEFPAAVAARARKIRVLLMDVDGVLTAGQVYLMPLADGTAVEMKAFHSQDGAGLKLARDAGLRTGVISGRESAAVTRRAQEVGMEFVFQGRGEKVPAYEEILRVAGVRDSDVAYIGDDLPDLPILERVGLAIAVANAVEEVRRAVHHVTRRTGGDAGVREAIEGILKAQGKWRDVSKKARA